MLEKIGLPERPSMRGNNWVVDASHCQGCSSQFTFINRKHHCRRCGGLFCGTCTQQRMVLRGQGDSPVRICDPCKKLEEAARFELRHGIKKKAGRGSSKLTSRDEDEVLDQILGSEKKDFVSSKSNASNSSASDLQEHDTETGPSSPEELRQQAVEEKNKYKTLRAKGKPEEALKAFKRGKELERQADALELSLRKNRRKAASLVNNAEIHNTDDVASSSGRKNELSLRNSKDKDDVSSGRKNELNLRNSKDKDDVSSELKELGWSDLDLHNAEKKPAPMSLEGELFSLLGEVSQKSGTGNASRGIDKTQVLALKKQALALKREGKLGEAKEKLKEAKILEKRLEEQEFLGEDEESDDELSALIRGMDNDGHDNMVANFQSGPGFNFDQLLNDDMDGNFEVTDEDMYDPDMDAALKSLGWDGETNDHFEDREALSSKVQSLKTEAIGQKLAGTNSVEAMDLLKKAKLPEKPFKEYEDKGKSVKSAPKSRLMIQKELLGIKKKALALRREGKSSEADEELRKGKVLEQQLEEMDNVPNVKEDKAMRVSRKHDESIPLSDIGDEVDADVTDNDMQDPAYLGLLKNLGWDEEDDKKAPVVKNDPYRAKAESSLPKRSKGEIQRELLGLKRKAFTLRRQGNNEEAEETQKMAKVLESQLEDMEVPKVKEDKAVRVSRKHDESIPLSDIGDEVDADVTDNDMQDPAYLGLLKNLGWDEEDDKKAPVVKSDPYHAKAESSLPKRSKGEIQRELLGLKRKALTLRRQGNNEEAEETQKMAKMLESQLEEMEVPKKEVKPEIQNHFEDDNSVKQENCVVADLLKSNDKIHHEKREEVVLDENPQVNRPEKIQSTLANNEQSSLREQILNLKRNAFAFKKKGLMAEAKEELRKAKVLEKKIEENSVDQGASSSSSSPNIAPVVEIENNSSPSKISKPLSSRDRFKLQQESLGLKRLSRKLRMEGRNDEADAEFEKAKAIEAQLEELADKPSTSGTNPVDDVGVEDLLDPQLLSALRAIGIDDSSTKSQSPDKIEPPKKSTNSGNERAQLEEQIKAEKAKAVALKRSGKKTEALDALRQAKMYEKKLNSLSQ